LLKGEKCGLCSEMLYVLNFCWGGWGGGGEVIASLYIL